MLRWISIIFAIVASSLVSAFAQRQDLSYHALTPREGLSHVSANGLYQDPNGAIWIATRDGLNRYDGSEISIFRREKDCVNSLSSSNIFAIDGDDADHLYVSSSSGVSVLNINTEVFTEIRNQAVNAIHWSGRLYVATGNKIEWWNSETGLFETHFVSDDKDLTIKYIYVGSLGEMWIGTLADGLYILRTNGDVTHLVKEGNITNIFEDSKGNIWFGSWNDGLYFYDRDDYELHNFTKRKGDINSLPSNFVRDIVEDNIGNIWVATDRGLCRYIADSENFIRYKSRNNNSSIWRLIKDAQGSIWFASYFGGVSWFNPEHVISFSYRSVNSYSKLFENSVIGKMIEDASGQLWICTEGSGVYIYDRKSGNVKELVDKNGDSAIGDNVKAICYDKERDMMWFGTHLGGLYSYHIPTSRVRNYRYDPMNRWSIPSDIIRDIEIRDGKLILGTFNGVALFDPETAHCERLFIDTQLGRKILIVTNMLISSDDTLWIGVESQGLFKFDFSTHELSNYHYVKGDLKSLSSNTVSTLVEDSKGNVWIGHESAGLDLYDRESDSFINFDTKSAGIVGDRIYEICDNLDGTLSLSTGGGLSILDVASSSSYNYTTQMGYNLLSPNENAMCRTHDNVIFIGGVDGMISFDMGKFIATPKRDYSLYFSGLYVNEKPVHPLDGSGILDSILPVTSSITLPNNASSFSVDFTSTNYIPEIAEPLEYMLDGFDSEWIRVRGDNISYTNIPPGEYSLLLKSVANSDRIQSAKLDIIIEQIWYKTAWAWLVYTIIIALLISYLNSLYRQRIKLAAQVKYEQDRVADIEQQNHLKLQFFTNISHEFRTPLSVIIGQIELLLSSKQLTSAARSRITSIHKSSNELNALIGELLDFRKQEQGHLRLNISKANVTELFTEISELYGDYIASRGVAFKLNIPSEELSINCDIVQLRKVITNLLSNAIKFTRKGGAITLSLMEVDNQLIIKVKDNGIGISQLDIDHIFDRFYQSQSRDRIAAGGTGIGLSFAKAIVELHGGTISVESELGKGSCFIVKLPMSLRSTLDELEVIDNQSPMALDMVPELITSDDSDRKVKVLIVEDDPQLLKMLVDIFSSQYAVSTANDGDQGIEQARAILPQIIVSDVMMPNVSGIELCTTLKGDVATSHIPIVLLTARSTSEQAIEGLSCGADDYIVKPFDVNLLLARCNNLVNNRVLLQERYSAQPEENTVKMASNALDQQILERAMSIIDKHIDNPEFDIATFSTQMAMSRTNLFNKIKAITGLTPNDFILTVRLKRSATLLLNNPEMSITEVAESVGFSGHRHFGKRFKERFGLSPLSYRQNTHRD